MQLGAREKAPVLQAVKLQVARGVPRYIHNPVLASQLVLADIGIPEGVYRKLGLGYSTPFDRRSRVPLRRLP